MPRPAKSNPDPLAWIDDLPPTLSRDETAKHSGCSTRHIDRAIVAGEIATLVLGRKRRVLRDSWKRWMARGLGR
jgi:excisionase family DNA binding protein